MPAEEYRTCIEESIATAEELRPRGVFLGGEALQPVRTGVTLHRKRGELSFTDGPFAETKEQLAGFILLEAPDLEAAKEIAKTLPPACLGPVEIRPVWERDDLLARRVPAEQEGAETRS
jgi:hypothetical protein